MLWIAIILILLIAWGLAIRDNMKWKTVMETPEKQPEKSIAYYNYLKSNGVRCRKKNIGSAHRVSQGGLTGMGRFTRIDVREEDLYKARSLLSDYDINN
ncbi:hypothetical protein E3U55_10315 [Filobacillus milosensis]|uniref:DUF2007 domain-containing protein n=1 Tax=Filobacillus milosensis TaxID=94137 RepID=A0A4Y8IG11_9BACI|nr:hypothetical protein [Filobacillus milosensis]TFB19547.1 hypothetical protein E3U55_10315 [Filobacillus milosensis]